MQEVGVYPPFKLTFWVKKADSFLLPHSFLVPGQTVLKMKSTGKKCNSSYSKVMIHN